MQFSHSVKGSTFLGATVVDPLQQRDSDPELVSHVLHRLIESLQVHSSGRVPPWGSSWFQTWSHPAGETSLGGTDLARVIQADQISQQSSSFLSGTKLGGLPDEC